jgi:iron complex outermembrane recepter protein
MSEARLLRRCVPGTLLMLSSCASLGWTCNSYAAATAESAETGDVAEVVVTALRHETTLLDAPAAVTVLTADAIQSAGIQTLADVSRVVPALRFEGGIRPGVPSISIRGVAGVQGGDAPVSLIVDGVQIPYLELFNQDLLDVSDIELLRGPQGALYGRGAIAGALVINTRRPTNSARDDVHASYSSGSDTRVTNTLDGPILPDKVWGQLTVGYQNRTGQIENVFLDRDMDFVHATNLRANLFANPDELTQVELRAAYSYGRYGTNELSKVPVSPAGAIMDFNTYRPSMNYENADLRLLESISLKIDRQTPIGTLTSVSQYAYSRTKIYNDVDYSPVPQRINFNPIADHAFNQDLRLGTTTPGGLLWNAGAFFQSRSTENDLHITVDPQAVPPFLPGLTSLEFSTSRAWAVYGEIGQEFAHGISLTAAGRYDSERRFDELTNVPGSGAEQTFSSFQPSMTLQEKFSPTLSAYATVGKGFRSGGFNAQNLVTPLIGAQRVYPKEETWSYEIGSKAELWDRRLMLTLAAFHIDYRDGQFAQTIVTPVVARFITSIDREFVNGVEAEMVLKPVPELTVSLSGNFDAATIREFKAVPDYVGNMAPNVYRDSEHLSVEYRRHAFGDFDALGRVDVDRRGTISYDLSDRFKAAPGPVLDARLGIDSDRWGVAVFGRNLTDRRFPQYFLPLAFTTAGARLENLPITFGVEIHARFE